jgi:thiamine-phosphate pyrophosphorylase
LIRCYITNSHTLAAESLLDSIARNLAAGITWIQIREKDLSARALFHLVQAARALPNPHGSKILVNTRFDIALAAGADGVHLPSGSPAPALWRAVVPTGFLIGTSCHSVEEVRQAEAEGAGYAVFGPVFSPLSKTSAIEPTGLDALANAAAAVQIPVLALGGVTAQNSAACLAAGAAGVAGITIFQT